MKLIYHLSDDARKHLFVEIGRDPGQVQSLEIDPADLSQEERALLAELGAIPSGAAHLQFEEWGGWQPSSAWLRLESPAANATELLAAYRDARAAGRARVDAAESERIEEAIAAFRAWREPHRPGMLNTSMYKRSPRRQEWIAAHAEAVAHADEIARRIEAQRDREAAAKEAEKQARLAERKVWALEYGSPRLRKCVEGDYDCQRLYVFERAAREHPGYIVDFDDRGNWKVRSGPSEAALDEAARVGGEVVWITAMPGIDYEEEEPGEAVVIRGYLGKYDLIRFI